MSAHLPKETTDDCESIHKHKSEVLSSLKFRSYYAALDKDQSEGESENPKRKYSKVLLLQLGTLEVVYGYLEKYM